MIEVRFEPTFDSWQQRARQLLKRAVPPETVIWTPANASHTLLHGFAADEIPERDRQADRLMVPRRFVESARWVAAHRDQRSWGLMYRVVWRILHENRALLQIASDPDIAAFAGMEAHVRRDEHKMRAFVRFRRVEDPDGERYVAWYRPDHFIVRLAAPFFAERFANMRWSILTPDESVHWNGRQLDFSAGVPRDAAPDDDALEELWRAYYASVFNPARANLKATRAEMPTRHWTTLPEASLIPQLLADAPARVRAFRQGEESTSARPFVPEIRTVETLKAAAAGCRGCPLYERATGTVFGEGSSSARLVLVGEQPGDEEDLRGRPFVGPAGGVLDRALAEAGIDRADIYLTNAVKHFKWEPRGKRRIHQTPRLSEIRACRPWLEAELQAIRPAVLVALGSTAARALYGPQFRVMSQRGQIVRSAWAGVSFATLHPSAVLRADDPGAASQYFGWIVADLKLARDHASATTAGSQPI